jgi:hypothetical protein
MKKTFLFGIALAGIFLTSCLGDNESKQTASNQFAVVKVKSGTKYAAASGGIYGGWYLVHESIDKYEEGDALFIGSYEVNTKNFIDSELIRANYVNISEAFPRNVQKTVSIGSADTIANVKADIGVKNLACMSYASTEFFSNKALFEYTINQKDGEIYDVSFVYDKDKQVNQAGQKLTDECVVDVILSKRNEGVGEPEDKSKRIVANFSDLRSLLRPSEIPNEGVRIIINLRYSKYDISQKKYKLAYVPKVMSFDYRKEN